NRVPHVVHVPNDNKRRKRFSFGENRRRIYGLPAAGLDLRLEVVELPADEKGLPRLLELPEPMRAEIAVIPAEPENVEPACNWFVREVFIPEGAIGSDLEQMFRVETGGGLVVGHDVPITDQRGIEGPAELMLLTDKRDLGLFNPEFRLMGPLKERVIARLRLLDEGRLSDPLIGLLALPGLCGRMDDAARVRRLIARLPIVKSFETLLISPVNEYIRLRDEFGDRGGSRHPVAGLIAISAHWSRHWPTRSRTGAWPDL